VKVEQLPHIILFALAVDSIFIYLTPNSVFFERVRESFLFPRKESFPAKKLF